MIYDAENVTSIHPLKNQNKITKKK